MAATRWGFRDEDLRTYSVELEHQVLSGQRRILVNGREVFRGGKFGDTSGEHAFDVDGHSASISIGSNGFGYTYTLTVGGLRIPAEGATIPRPPRLEVDPAPRSPGAATTWIAPPAPAMPSPRQTADAATVARVALVHRVESGGRWFYWIAGLSLINFALYAIGSDIGFALGTAIDWLVDGVLRQVAPSFTWLAHVGTIALFAFLGLRATAGVKWAFVVGGVLYAIDALAFLFIADWLALAIHAFALFGIVRALRALRTLGIDQLSPAAAPS
jgi:FAIM1 (Fas apoptotic inhibitory molecule) protein